MTTPETIASSERVLITWLREQTVLEADLLQKTGRWNIATRLPSPLPLPFLVVQALPGGGLITAGQAPVTETVVQFDVYAGTDMGLMQDASEKGPDASYFKPDIRKAQDISLVVYGLSVAVLNYRSGAGHLYGIETQGEPVRIPEDELGLARYSFDGLVQARANA